jgi:hypothetical protein
MSYNLIGILRVSAAPREMILCLASLFALFLVGCMGDGAAARYTVTGKVTHQGQPVEKGTIQFENPTAGQSNSSPLGPGGVYSLDVPAGEYKVSVSPPTVMAKGTGDSPPDEIPDPNVKNIPKKYRVVESSGLTAQVDKDKRSFDFELKP